MYLSVASCEFSVCGFVGEVQQRLVVDVAAGAPAPSDKVGRTDVGLDGPDTLALQVFECLLRCGFPFVEGRVPAPLRKDGFE